VIEFSSEVRVGDLLVVAGFVGTGIAFFSNLKNRINVVDLKMTYIEAQLEDLQMATKNNNLIEERLIQKGNLIEALTKRVDELAHWKGFISPDGEWARYGRRMTGRIDDDENK
jgi:hypothetical protein